MNLHLFIAGTGGVGKALIEQIDQKRQFLHQNLDITLIINGTINSRQMRLKEDGEWIGADLSTFISAIKNLQAPNSIFIDVTANENVASTYLDLLQNGIHVVACNKIACSASMAYYKRLKAAAQKSGALFLYNTNVGAALPYLQSIRQLYLAGERIDRVEAVLSGTLSYIFDCYNGTLSFEQIVREAHLAGYTEPDPRIDLRGIDVMRKLLILCREMEVPLEENEIEKTAFLPESCLQGSVDDFYRELLRQEDYFKGRYLEAQAFGGKLKYVASWQPGKAAIGLQTVMPGNPVFNIGQKENILLVYSQHYLSPLAITGAGAGAPGTAMGVLSDVVTIGGRLLLL